MTDERSRRGICGNRRRGKDKVSSESNGGSHLGLRSVTERWEPFKEGEGTGPMGDEQRNALLGRVRTIESPEGVCAIAVRGFLSIAVINEVVSQIDRLASAEPSIRAV